MLTDSTELSVTDIWNRHCKQAEAGGNHFQLAAAEESCLPAAKW